MGLSETDRDRIAERVSNALDAYQRRDPRFWGGAGADGDRPLDRLRRDFRDLAPDELAYALELLERIAAHTDARRRMMRFAGATSALDQLADALRRADATWRCEDAVVEWGQLTDDERGEWRATARTAATTVVEEMTAETDRRPSG